MQQNVIGCNPKLVSSSSYRVWIPTSLPRSESTRNCFFDALISTIWMITMLLILSDLAGVPPFSFSCFSVAVPLYQAVFCVRMYAHLRSYAWSRFFLCIFHTCRAASSSRVAHLILSANRRLLFYNRGYSGLELRIHSTACIFSFGAGEGHTTWLDCGVLLHYCARYLSCTPTVNSFILNRENQFRFPMIRAQILAVHELPPDVKQLYIRPK